jgi:hypothetical protein
MQAGRRLALVLVSAAALVLAGCRNRAELVENELRARDIQYREALEELSRIESHNQAMQHELDALRSGARVLPEHAAQIFGLRRITLGRGTGGYDHDGLPGDELLQVIIEPRDVSEHTIKSPGTAHILALEINPQGMKVPIGQWDVGPDELHNSWKQTLLSTGYVLRLPWKLLPRSEEVRIVARLVLADGRVYEADRDVKVRLIPGRTSQPPLMPPAIEETAPPLAPATHWQKAPLDGAVQLGRPLPD